MISKFMGRFQFPVDISRRIEKDISRWGIGWGFDDLKFGDGAHLPA